jgi:serpin B
MTACRSLAVLAALAFFTACGSSAGTQKDAEPPGERVGSSEQRVTTPAPSEDLASAVQGSTELALDLYRVLAASEGGNLFFSPQSISFALSTTYAGAAGDTATAFRDTLNVTLPEAQYHRAMNDLDRQLGSRGAGAAGADGQPFRLRLVNQFFAQSGFSFEAPFLDILAEEYGADVRLLDFMAAPEPARLDINAWVAEATEDRILDLLGPGTIGTETRAVLVNAIYFSAAWASAFEPSATENGPFTLLDGSTVSVPTMHDDDVAARTAQVGGVDVVELPYDGGELSMVLLLPPVAEFSSFEEQLTASLVQDLLAALQDEHLSLALPRFQVRTSASLSAPLTQLGLGVAFTDAADFSRMSAVCPLVIEDVVHQAYVNVNEAGTEAAAATGVITGPTSAPENRSVAIDRPFLFLIRDHATGAIVFLGRVVSP